MTYYAIHIRPKDDIEWERIFYGPARIESIRKAVLALLADGNYDYGIIRGKIRGKEVGKLVACTPNSLPNTKDTPLIP